MEDRFALLKEHLAAAGFDPSYGARPLRRAIQRLLVDVLAQRILAGEFSEGDTVVVDGSSEGLTFQAAQRTPVAA